MKKLLLSVDGAAKGNPGPAGIGVVIYDESGCEILSIGEYIGSATNNTAEYAALLRGLQECANLGADSVLVQTDSELVARQLTGAYKVKSPHLQPLYNEAKRLFGQFKSVSVKHVPREKNKHADKLASSAAESQNSGSPRSR